MLPELLFEWFVKVAEVEEALGQHIEAFDVVENCEEDLIPPVF
jgi:hypothetical protein